MTSKIQCTNTDGTISSRVSISPSFNQTQSGALGTERLAISFSTLSDLTDVLGVKDEYDYERLFSKEVITEIIKFIQLLGTVSKYTTQSPDNDAECGKSSSSFNAS